MRMLFSNEFERRQDLVRIEAAIGRMIQIVEGGFDKHFVVVI